MLRSDVLQISLVDSQGEHIILNQYTDPDHFWAIRGGGGSAWGVCRLLCSICEAGDADTIRRS